MISHFMLDNKPDDVLDLESLTSFQRQQLDPAWDFLEENTECLISKIDIFYIQIVGLGRGQRKLFFHNFYKIFQEILIS